MKTDWMLKALVFLSAVYLSVAANLTLVGAEPFRFKGDSTLPLMIIDTGGEPIPNEPKIDATLSVMDAGRGKVNRLSDSPLMTTRIRIETRGASSQMFDKKSFGFETVNKKNKDKDTPLLGLPAESDWILYAPHSDKTLMRNYMAYGLSNEIGRYAPGTRFVEVFVRDSKAALPEQYVGVYLLIEKIKRGDDRVDFSKLRREKREGKKAGRYSGGYIVKIDRVDGPESYLTTDYGTVLGLVSPRGDRVSKAERSWIAQDFSRFERALAGGNFRDPSNGYAKYADLDSFVDFFLLNELFKNVDAYFLSTFLHRQNDGKIHMGPIWDLNLSSGNGSYGGVWHTEDWILLDKPPRNRGGLPFWWDRMFQDPQFCYRLVERWHELRENEFATESILAQVDRTAERLDSAQQRNFQRWPILGNYIWPNPRPYAKTYDGEIRQLKSWLQQRTIWIDENIDALGTPAPVR